MTGYEFTRYEADFTSTTKASGYDISIVALQIKRYLPEYKNSDYEDAKDNFIEVTMSCDKHEAIRWMEYFMSNAIAYGISTKNRDWRTKFMAAYDIFNSLV